jgi:hypothetical protein
MLLSIASGFVLLLFRFLSRFFWPPTNSLRQLCPLKSIREPRIIGSIQITDQLFHTDEGNVGKCEMDTHADTCVVGANFLACKFDGTTCEVIPFYR